MSSINNTKITLFGSFLAFSSGFFISVGYKTFNQQLDTLQFKNLLLNSVGGGFAIVGIYFLSPASVRSVWT